MTRILITGGCGFIGSNFVRHVLAARPDAHVVNLDALTYAASPATLADLEAEPRYTFSRGDITDEQAVAHAFADPPDVVLHFAAESHVDRSITGPEAFVTTNVLGTHRLLEAARAHGTRFVQIGTDEVYGSLGPEGLFTEQTPLDPSSPYSASKASADLLTLAYHRTYGLPTIVTRCSNNYGPYQFPEKVLPLFITNLMDGQQVPLYGDGGNVREWLHVDDHCSALLAVAERGRPGEVYNIGSSHELDNLTLTHTVLRLMDQGEEMIRYVTDRLGHDRRYAVDSTKLRDELGWAPAVTFDEGLAQTISWYRDNRGWWEPLKHDE